VTAETVAFVISLIALGLSLFTLVLTLASYRPSRPSRHRQTELTSGPLIFPDGDVNLYRVSSSVLRTDKKLDG
jgi:hypothetical protein